MEQVKERIKVDLDEEVIPPKVVHKQPKTDLTKPIVAGGLLLGLATLLGVFVQPQTLSEIPEDMDTPILTAIDLVEQLTELTLAIVDSEFSPEKYNQVINALYNHSHLSESQLVQMETILAKIPNWKASRTEKLEILWDPIYIDEIPYSDLHFFSFQRDLKNNSPEYLDAFLSHCKAFSTIRDLERSNETLVTVAMHLIAGFLGAPHTATYYNLAQVLRALGKFKMADRLIATFKKLGANETQWANKYYAAEPLTTVH